MRQVMNVSKRAVQSVYARVAVLVLSLSGGGVAVWQGYTHWVPRTDGPVKQITTGIAPGSAGKSTSVASASLTDDQQPSSRRTHQLMAYGQPAEAAPATSPSQPPTNPYLPSSGDPPGGYGTRESTGSRYSPSASAYAPASAPAQPSTLPSTDPSATQSQASLIPTNPYRVSDAGATATSAEVDTQAASPYATASTSGQATPGETTPASSADLTPATDVASAYANRFSRGASTSAATTDPTPSSTLAPPATLPGNTLPSSDSASGSYASAQGLRALPPSQTPAARPEAGGKLAAATPGERQLEGPQQPAITLEKVSPSEIQVGKPATFDLYVRNVGQVPAHQVVVTDHVPAGTQLQGARPQPQQAADGSLVWNLGTMQPGEQTQITLQVMPQSEGEIGSTAHVSFAAAATSRSICTRPQLTIEHTAPPKVLIGEALAVTITISNPGSGPATGIIIEEDVPDGLVHTAGAQLEYEVGTLRPGESKRLELSLKAQKAGMIQNTITARGDGSLAAQHVVQLEVVAPQLHVEVEGPKRRFLERQATYTLQVANPGTASARDVEVVAYLPRGMKFVNTDAQGQYDPNQHAVFWSLAELPPAKAGAVKLTTLPVEAGEQRLRIESRADLGLTAAGEQIVQVEQAAELLHTVKDLDEVIEVGSETTYEIRVSNSGTKAATNVRIVAVMPAGMTALGGEGPTRAGGDATQVVFEPLVRLNPREEVVYKVQVQGKQPGDHIVRVQLSSDEWPTPVTREESTRVYQDR
jgi:uncharacterized repeat protein (TIGR01451 family)